MRIRTRITQLAHQRGLTAAEVARRLGLYRSNLSAMDAGRRSVSLKTLSRIAQVLACSPGELLEPHGEAESPVFRDPALNSRLETLEAELVDGTECGWVHTVLLAWQRHYRPLTTRQSA